MTLQTRLIIASLLLIIFPLLLMTYLINSAVGDRLRVVYQKRVLTQAGETMAKMEEENDNIHYRLNILKDRMIDDNHFRLGAIDGRQNEQVYLRDYAGKVMALMGLSMLEIQDENGVILSSGHFPSEFRCTAEILPGAWSESEDMKKLAFRDDRMFFTQIRRPEDLFPAWVCFDSVVIGGKTLTIMGGLELDEVLLFQLSSQRELAVSLIYPNSVISSNPIMKKLLIANSFFEFDSMKVELPENDYSTQDTQLPYLMSEGDGVWKMTKAVLLVSYARTELHQLLSDLQRWLLWVALAAGVGTMIIALWMSFRISRPLADLANQTERIELDGYYSGFETHRSDEVGTLARLLDRLSQRLQISASNLREVERRATLGDVARQVNHDIKNGLIPMRNVFRHLAQEAQDNPAAVGNVFRERKHVIEDSITYLEGLAKNYARLSHKPRRELCDIERIIEQVVSVMGSYSGVTFGIEGRCEYTRVLADPISLRRVVENIIRNACDSLSGVRGRVEILMDNKEDTNGRMGVRIKFSDNGPGIPLDSLGSVFDDFYTTKDTGAGLGLSIVRRLVTDCDGYVRAENNPDQGACFTVWLPVVNHETVSAITAYAENRYSRGDV